MIKTRVNYSEYRGLFPHELFVIVAYMDRNDPEPLDKIIKETFDNVSSPFAVKSQAMKKFISDLIKGKIKRPKASKASTLLRDFEISLAIDDLLFYEGRNLTSNRDKAGAAAIVGEQFGCSEDAAIKAYNKFKDTLKTPKPK